MWKLQWQYVLFIRLDIDWIFVMIFIYEILNYWILHLGIISLYNGLLKTILIENFFQKKQLLKVWHYALKIWILSTPTEFFLSFAPILCWTWADAFWLHTDHSYTPASFYLFRLEKENKVFQLYQAKESSWFNLSFRVSISHRGITAPN